MNHARNLALKPTLKRTAGKLSFWRPRGGFASGFLLLSLVAALPAAAESYPVAVLQGLDKVTARVSTIEAPVGETVHFGTLQIIARSCDKRPPEEPPESAAFLDIWEVRRGEPAVTRYRGWMFASSPALSALEHPVYDVWVLDCRKASSPDSSSSSESSGTNAAPADSASPSNSR